MLSVEDISRIAYKEHEHRPDNVHAGPSNQHVSVVDDEAAFVGRIQTQLKDISSISSLSKASPPLALVSFKCLLQDTGYPMEVYLPDGAENLVSREMDWTRLKERWVGWGVEVPGEQQWARKADHLSNELSNLSIDSHGLPVSVHAKYPLPGQKGNYLGALIKVYDEASFKPASVHEFIGILSQSPLPSNDLEHTEFVPTIHVLRTIGRSDDPVRVQDSDLQVREDLLGYLATAFNPPDRLAAEYLLLLLLSSPSSRPPSMSPIGSLSINFRRQDNDATAGLTEVVSSVIPRVVSLPLTLSLLHSHPFLPSSTDTSSLDAGLLQLGEGTVLLVDEDGMGDGGLLNEKALKNLKALAECMTEQKVRYMYPYMDGLKMDCAARVAVLSQGKTMLPVDVSIPVRGGNCVPAQSPDLERFRSFLSRCASPAHASRLIIPAEIAQTIQDQFVRDRKDRPDQAEETLKRRMKVARLLALSYPEAELNLNVWKEAVRMDEEVDERHT